MELMNRRVAKILFALSGCATVFLLLYEPKDERLVSEGEKYMFGENTAVDYQKAMEYFGRAAEMGNAEAYFYMAGCWLHGCGVERDTLRAVEYYRRAAESGLPDAQYHLGLLYQYGIGLEEDAVEAAGWFRKAADELFPEAQAQLGTCYETGYGVGQDYGKAVRYYRDCRLMFSI